MDKKTNQLILVIDDSTENQILLKTLLESCGYKVESALNGAEALGLLQKLVILPDLIFLDAFMPLMNGQQFRIEQMRNLKFKDIPVVVMSGDSQTDLATTMSQPRAVLSKPLSVKLVLETLRNILPQE